MELRTVLGPAARGFNAAVLALAALPWIGPRIRRHVAEITYVGRRSGRTISTPVGVHRSGAEVIIDVSLPDRKTWWRNFLGDGAPMSLRLGESTHAGYATAHRSPGGDVTVHVQLAD